MPPISVPRTGCLSAHHHVIIIPTYVGEVPRTPSPAVLGWGHSLQRAARRQAEDGNPA